MSLWARDPELFLYKGKDGVVHLWRCKKETTTATTMSMLMTPEDFKDEGVVTDHLSLYGFRYDWDKNKYEALIDFIYSKHLLVNSRGSLIAELVATDDKAAPVVYIRALDIPDMHKSYGLPKRRTVPARTVKYLEDGTVVSTDSNPNEIAKLKEDLTQKIKEAAALQQDLTKEIKKNKALEERNAAIQEDLTEEIKKNKALKERNALLQQDLTEEIEKNKALEERNAAIQQDLTKEIKKNKALEERNAAIQQDLTEEINKNKALEERNAQLEEDIKNCDGAKPSPPTVRIYTAADTCYSLTILDGRVILGANNKYDVYQYWIKDDKYGSSVKDASGLPCYALVNKFTCEAMKPPSAAMEDVQLVPYNPDILDRSILWSEHDQGDGYRAIRSATHTSLNLDAFDGDEAHGGVRDGTPIKVGNWLAGNNQRWNIVPYCKYPHQSLAPSSFVNKIANT